MDIKFPGTGYGPDGKKMPYQIVLNGQPFAGHSEQKRAQKAFDSYSEQHRAISHVWELLHDGVLVQKRNNPTRGSIAKEKK